LSTPQEETVLLPDSVSVNPDDITAGIDSADGGSPGDPAGASAARDIDRNKIK